MKQFALFAILLTFTLFNCTSGFAVDDDGIIEYPDGSLGMDIGGGYQTMPKIQGEDEDFMPAPGYRDDYKDTRYGPMTEQGAYFPVMPSFSLPGTRKPVEKTEEEKEQIFYQMPPEEMESTIWGFSGQEPKTPDE
ncbi:MAG: hypothetical protein HQ594_01285 [Candidatus Omnitrophica bacterium]|nr:hypothetical protein [Candidatus Omnitrophota bacterium]